MNATRHATPSAAIEAACIAENLDLRNELECFIWDVYKSIHGIRPRWYKFSDWTVSELIEEVDSLGLSVQREREREEEQKKQKILAANAKAAEARKFNRNFNSLAVAFG